MQPAQRHRHFEHHSRIVATAQLGEASGNFWIAASGGEFVLDNHRVKQIRNGAHRLCAHAWVRISFGDFEQRFAIARVRKYPDSVKPSRHSQSVELSLEIRYTIAPASFYRSLRVNARIITI